MDIYLGIDPGLNGGAAMVDGDGLYVGSVRWRIQSAAHILDWLAATPIVMCYLEKIEIFRHLPRNVILNMQGLLVNSGIWQGFMLSLGIPYCEVKPQDWQDFWGLRAWKRNQARFKEIRANLEVQSELAAAIDATTPLGKARALWPEAPMPHGIDDGVAVALLLAGLARMRTIAAPEPQQACLQFRRGRKK